MKVLVQRSKASSVSIDGKIVGKIDNGLVLLVGFTYGDNIDTIKSMIDKIINLRIFGDNDGVMNRSLLDIKGEILSISQFTLYANTLKGRRPSYVDALNPDAATILYDEFNDQLRELGIAVATGVFGADMQVLINNDGPVTIMLER